MVDYIIDIAVDPIIKKDFQNDWALDQSNMNIIYALLLIVVISKGAHGASKCWNITALTDHVSF